MQPAAESQLRHWLLQAVGRQGKSASFHAPANCTTENGVTLQPCCSSCPLWRLQRFCLLCSFSPPPKCKEPPSTWNRLECPLMLLLTLLRTGQGRTMTLDPNPQIKAFPVSVLFFKISFVQPAFHTTPYPETQKFGEQSRLLQSLAGPKAHLISLNVSTFLSAHSVKFWSCGEQ